jgi:predicted transcriptional regulator
MKNTIIGVLIVALIAVGGYGAYKINAQSQKISEMSQRISDLEEDREDLKEFSARLGLYYKSLENWQDGNISLDEFAENTQKITNEVKESKKQDENYKDIFEEVSKRTDEQKNELNLNY